MCVWFSHGLFVWLKVAFRRDANLYLAFTECVLLVCVQLCEGDGYAGHGDLRHVWREAA